MEQEELLKLAKQGDKRSIIDFLDYNIKNHYSNDDWGSITLEDLELNYEKESIIVYLITEQLQIPSDLINDIKQWIEDLELDWVKDSYIDHRVRPRQSPYSILISDRANCRIWAHLLFWWLVPLGWIISTIKMRYSIPAFIVLGFASLAFLTNPYTKRDLSTEETITKSWYYGQKFGMVAYAFGSAITVRKIIQSRLKNHDSDYY